ncbi:MAG: hypothetical protein KF812_05630 [Fimbriimonadaceae bacterium]|nr:hypothetical protein [Fimbriimonadaceae bacterium]
MNQNTRTDTPYNPNPTHTQPRDEPMSQPPVVPSATDSPLPNNTGVNSPDWDSDTRDATNYDLGNHSIDEFEGEFRRYEHDFNRFEEENRSQPEEWWDESKRKVRFAMQGLRADLDQARDNGPEAWEEMKSGLRNALDDLKEGYRNAVRELKD